MERGQRVQIKIDDMTREGQGIGKSEGFAIFVAGAVTGDVVEVELTKVKKNYAFGRLLEIVETSPNRIAPMCKYAGDCGGCSLAALDYEGQLQYKTNLVEGSLKRLGGLASPVIREIKGVSDPFRYRNKLTMPISTGGIITRKGGIVENLGEATIGFYRAKSHDVIDCDDCLLQSEPAMAAVNAVRQFMEEDNITAYDPKWDKGLMRHIVVKTAEGTGEVMVVLAVNGKGIPNSEKLVSMLDDAIFDIPVYEDGVEYNLASVVVNVNKTKDMTGQILGDECITIAGKPTITDTCGDMKFEISPLAFYQVNPSQMKVLYDKAIEYANLSGSETVLDLYCGVGTIGLFAAKKINEMNGQGQVIGIESVKGAVLDANRNATINGIVNARFICGRVEEELPKLLGGDSEADLETPEGKEPEADEKTTTLRIEGADVVFLDPPRTGCDEKLLSAVADLAPERIVYVSCDPATLARDIKYLSDHGFEFVENTPVDMFPWSGHVETVVLITRAKE